jgi:hypothetical protein
LTFILSIWFALFWGCTFAVTSFFTIWIYTPFSACLDIILQPTKKIIITLLESIIYIYWIVVDILNLLSETKINYWFKHLLNCNISAIPVAIIKLINISKEKQIGYNLIRYIKQKIIILN